MVSLLQQQVVSLLWQTIIAKQVHRFSIFLAYYGKNAWWDTVCRWHKWYKQSGDAWKWLIDSYNIIWTFDNTYQWMIIGEIMLSSVTPSLIIRKVWYWGNSQCIKYSVLAELEKACEYIYPTCHKWKHGMSWATHQPCILALAERRCTSKVEYRLNCWWSLFHSM